LNQFEIKIVQIPVSCVITSHVVRR